MRSPDHVQYKMFSMTNQTRQPAEFRFELGNSLTK